MERKKGGKWTKGGERTEEAILTLALAPLSYLDFVQMNSRPASSCVG